MSSPAKTRTRRAPGATRRESPPANDKYFSRAVSKALESLDILRLEPGEHTLHSLAGRLTLSKTSAFRLLRTLEQTGHVTADARGFYQVLPDRLVSASECWVDRLIAVGQPRLRALGLELGETTSLAAYYPNRIEVVAVIESAQDVRMSNVVGHIVPPNASSLGKAITAFQPAERQDHLLRSFKIYRFTENTITDRKLLLREYQQVCLQGFAVDREECALGGVCFSVPVLAADGSAPAAISVSMPKTRLKEAEQEQQILDHLRRAADQLGGDLRLV